MPGENLEGVFVEGKPLAEYLEDLERDDKSRDIEAIRKQSEVKRKLTVVYSDEKGGPQDTRRVAKRVKHLTDREIRREYGIMKKPFKSNAENALWTIWEKGPICPKEIGEEIEFNGGQSSMSAMISTIWQRLGNMHDGAMDIITRNSKNMTYYYQKKPGVDMSAEAAIEKYKLAGTSKYRRKVADDIVAKNTVKYSKVEKPKPLTQKTEDLLQDLLGVSKALGIEIKVSGRVDIVFRFER